MHGDRLRILVGDARETLKELAPGSVDCVITSPPYLGLRDYGVEGQIGREPSLDGYVAALVDVFAEVHRTLRAEGTLWLNLGDSYEGSGRGAGSGKQLSNPGSCIEPVPIDTGLKPKDLMLVPARAAIALQRWGWWVRSEIVWAKENPMPESVEDRPTCSHEHIWLLTKRGRGYYYKDPGIPAAGAGAAGPEPARREAGGGPAGAARPGTNQALAEGCYGDDSGGARRGRRLAGLDAERAPKATRRLRNAEPAPPPEVWWINTASYPGAHFATFPPALVERCLEAGCPPQGVVLDPFGGAGTTAMVAVSTGRSAILCELNEGYAEMARRRVESGGRLDSDLRRQGIAARRRAAAERDGQETLL